MRTKKLRFEPLIAKYEEIAEEAFIPVSDGTILRVLRTKAPEETRNDFTLFLIPGWSTAVISWDKVLSEAMKFFDIVYFESREKHSSTLNMKTKNTLDRISEDVKEVVRHLELDEKSMVILASSWGAIFLADALAKKKINPHLVALSGTTAKLTLPKGTRHIIPFTPPFIFTALKPILRAWLANRKSEDEEQARKILRNLEEADARKWKKVVKYSMMDCWDLYEQIEQNTIIFGAELDKMHNFEETRRIVRLVKNSTYVDMKTNKNSHTKNVVTELRNHLKTM
ncbi:MAG: alpha/beta hydrolase [Candidatus Heimdallarchaeota archaeon]|nr:alpha/beta hydrolase [Candidatus Heimdallarchaeota archaeon]